MSGDLFAARVEGALRREQELQPQPQPPSPMGAPTGAPTGAPPVGAPRLGRKMVYVLALEADPPDPINGGGRSTRWCRCSSRARCSRTSSC